jgi:NitT/TauT family transport system permease protein
MSAPARYGADGAESRRWKAPESWLPTLALAVLAVALWEATIRLFHVSSFIVPAPSAIVAAMIREARPLAAAAVVTAEEILVGFIAAAAVGIVLALIIARFRVFGRALYPLVVLFQNVPKVALAPIFILWFGYDLTPKVGLIVVIAFFPVTLSILTGIEAVEPSLIALMHSVGARPNEILARIQVPYALPNLMAGLKIAATFSVIGAIVGEFAGASAGLGYIIQFASTQLDTALVFAALVVVSIVGVGFYYLVEYLEKLIVPWAPKFTRS